MQDSGSTHGCFDIGIKQKLNVCRTTSVNTHISIDFIPKKPLAFVPWKARETIKLKKKIVETKKI